MKHYEPGLMLFRARNVSIEAQASANPCVLAFGKCDTRFPEQHLREPFEPTLSVSRSELTCRVHLCVSRKDTSFFMLGKLPGVEL